MVGSRVYIWWGQDGTTTGKEPKKHASNREPAAKRKTKIMQSQNCSLLATSPNASSAGAYSQSYRLGKHWDLKRVQCHREASSESMLVWPASLNFRLRLPCSVVTGVQSDSRGRDDIVSRSQGTVDGAGEGDWL